MQPAIIQYAAVTHHRLIIQRIHVDPGIHRPRGARQTAIVYHQPAGQIAAKQPHLRGILVAYAEEADLAAFLKRGEASATSSGSISASGLCKSSRSR